jgi:hypothetical protein
MVIDWLKDLAEIAPITIPLAAIVAVIGLFIASKDRRLEKAFELVRERRKDKELLEARKYIREHATNIDKITHSDIITLMRNEDELFQKLLLVANDLEGIADSISRKIYDEKYLRSTIGNFLLYEYSLVESFIFKVKKHTPSIYVESEKLFTAWMEELHRSKMVDLERKLDVEIKLKDTFFKARYLIVSILFTPYLLLIFEKIQYAYLQPLPPYPMLLLFNLLIIIPSSAALTWLLFSIYRKNHQNSN